MLNALHLPPEMALALAQLNEALSAKLTNSGLCPLGFEIQRFKLVVKRRIFFLDFGE